ncbi:MAG: hypothetical protein WA746_11285, partial [Isosphaeraceae bacterium]
DKSRFYTDTFLGRTFFYCVERIGRIAMLWHAARHIVIFERSVVESEQFPDDFANPAWRGRAVLRKTQDYVQIDHPDRTYPEHGEAPQLRGFVLEAVFKNPIIPVDSRRWGRDVPRSGQGGWGWIVPLYNPAVISPAYPFPDIRLKLATSPGTKEPFVWGRVLNPDVLVFFTPTAPFPGSTQEPGIDTENWPALAGIDYPPQNLPSRSQDNAGVASGYERFTLKVDTGGQAVNLLHDRVNASTEVHIENVTLVRRSLAFLDTSLNPDTLSPKIQEVLSHKGKYAEAINQAVRDVGRCLGDVSLKQAEESVNRAQERIRQLGVEAAKIAGDLSKSVLATPEFTNVSGRLKNINRSVSDNWEKLWNDSVKIAQDQVVDLINSGLNNPQKEVNRALLNLRAVVASADTALGEAGRAAERVRDGLRSFLESLPGFSDSAREVLEKSFKGGKNDYYRDAVNQVARFRQLFRQLEDALGAYNPQLIPSTRCYDELKTLAGELLSSSPNIKKAFETFKTNLAQSIKKFVDPTFVEALTSALEELSSLTRSATIELTKFQDLDGRYRQAVDAKIEGFRQRFKQLEGELGAYNPELIPSIGCYDELDKLESRLLSRRPAIDDAIRTFQASLKSSLTKLIDISLLADPVLQKYEDIKLKLTLTCRKFDENISQRVQQILALPLEESEKARDLIRTGVEQFRNSVCDRIGEADKFIDGSAGQLKKWLGDPTDVENLAKRSLENATDLAHQLIRDLNSVKVLVAADVRQEVLGLIASASESAARSLAPVTAPLEHILREKEASILDLAAQAKNFSDQLKALSDRTLRLARAYGQSPVAQALEFFAPQAPGQVVDRLAYFFQEVDKDTKKVTELLDKVQFTPVQAFLNRGKESLERLDLKTLGLQLPTFSIGDRFIPDINPDQILKDVLPNVAGIDLTTVFQGLKVPSLASDNIHLTHGFDPTARRAWAQCDLKFPLDRESKVFEIGPLSVTLENGVFEAHSRIAVDPRGVSQKQVSAAVHGDWTVTAGSKIVSLSQTTLEYTADGKLNFSVSPTNVVVYPPLNFLADLVKSMPSMKGNGLSLEVLRNGGQVPYGFRSQLNLGLPPLQAGAFSLSNLDLHGFFELSMKQGFRIGSGVGLASKERPFNLTILFLGGGGWFDLAAYYQMGGGLSSRLQIGISAGASIAFDIGVAKGGIYFLVSLDVEWTEGSGGGHLAIELLISLQGEVSILSIISVSLLLALGAIYSDGTLTCRGVLALTIKICWCFSISVHEDVQFTLAHNSGSRAEIEKVVDQYFLSFGG